MSEMERVLTLPMKSVWYDQIERGEKDFEYRVASDFWRKRLEGKTFDKIVFTRGYPKKDDHTRRFERPWRGYEIKTIKHEEFGENPIEVFAIRCSPPQTQGGAG